MNIAITIISYLILINLAGFAIMGIDKHKAKKGAFRIPEATLFAFALFGGSLGTTCGMFHFHHKTRHWYFRYGMPFLFILQVCLALWLWLQYHALP
jgi:uncharacterized membrane protein YsdA (DUF1294 family)